MISVVLDLSGLMETYETLSNFGDKALIKCPLYLRIHHVLCHFFSLTDLNIIFLT